MGQFGSNHFLSLTRPFNTSSNHYYRPRYESHVTQRHVSRKAGFDRSDVPRVCCFKYSLSWRNYLLNWINCSHLSCNLMSPKVHQYPWSLILITPTLYYSSNNKKREEQNPNIWILIAVQYDILVRTCNYGRLYYLIYWFLYTFHLFRILKSFTMSIKVRFLAC